MNQNGEIMQLEEDWADFRDSSVSAKTTNVYQKLMIRTFPLLVEKWFENDKTVDKSIVPLICTLANVFEDPFDEKGNCVTNGSYKTRSFFHLDFMFSLLNDALIINEDGTIAIHAHPGQWIIDPKTFELPNEIAFSYED